MAYKDERKSFCPSCHGALLSDDVRKLVGRMGFGDSIGGRHRFR
jgi:hypothetical protein